MQRRSVMYCAAVPAFKLVLAGQEHALASFRQLQALTRSVLDGQARELWLSHETFGSLRLLVNHGRACLMHLPDGGGDHPGFTSRGAAPRDAREVAVFVLSNGQMDELPISWTVPREDGLQALEHFFLTGSRAPWLVWHDDST